MPIVAVIGAIGTAVFAGADIAAVGLTVGTALEATAAIGATLGAVGAVTRDRGLQTAGMVLGGIGAVGSLAGAAGLFSTSDSLFGSTAGQTADIAAGGSGTSAGVASYDAASGTWAPGAQGFPDMTEAAANEFGGIPNMNTPVDTATLPPPGSGLPGGIPSDAGAATAAPNDDATASANYGSGSGLLNSNGAANSPASTGTPPTMAVGNGLSVPQTLSGVNVPPPQVPIPGGNAPGAVATTPGFFSGLMNNPWAQYGMVQAAGSLVQGAFNQLTPAQVALYNAQAANNRAAASLTSKQVSNMNGAMPVATLNAPKLAPVSGTPQGSGLLNSNVTGSVTGQPAYA